MPPTIPHPDTVTGAPGFLSTVSAHRTTLALGAFLMLGNSAVDVAKGVLFYPILANHSRRTALAYLAAMIVEVVLLSVGVLGLLMTIPLAQHAAGAGGTTTDWAKTLGSVALQWNTMAYQIGEMALGVGAVFLCWLLLRTRLIPQLLAGWGVIGYAILVLGGIAEIFGIHISLILSIPGGLFELGLGCWLIVKGFQPAAYDGPARYRQSLLVPPQPPRNRALTA